MWRYLLLFSILFCLASCSDDSSGTEYLFDREILEMNVLRSCADGSDSLNCFRIRYRYPIETEHLEKFLVWLDTTVIDDTTRSVSKEARENATFEIPYSDKKTGYYDTLDITEEVREFADRDSLQVAIWPEYSDGDDPGAVQRVFVHFGDDMAPAVISLQDSVWTDGAAFDWSRPTDQTDFYSPELISGAIAGYNVVIYTLNENEDIRKVKVKVIRAIGTDSSGGKFYYKHHRFRSREDSVYLDTTSASDKRYLRLAIPDGEGFSETDSLNRFRLVLQGLRAESKYTIGITTFDSSGNYSGSTVSAEYNQMFITTDSVAPLMPTKLFVLQDSADARVARLDSNNRLRIFWSRSIDPYKKENGIREDSVLVIPDTCYENFCFRNVESYQIDKYDGENWTALTEAGGKVEERYQTRYNQSGDTLVYAEYGDFVTDTIRWVSPGDTLILRVRAKDSSGYYSRALIDTIVVTLGNISGLNCPDGFLPVETDSSKFCMEKFEHRDSSGFMHNVLFSEAKAACESVSASGFTVSLCKERDWELVCLSGGTVPYGVVEENSLAASEYLYTNCNVATNDSLSAASLEERHYKCVNTTGVRDLPGQYQEWTLGRSEDTLAVLKGSSYLSYDGLDRETVALCTNRFFPYYTRPSYVKDTVVYLYRSGTVVDTTLVQDTTRTLYKKLTQKDFRDTLQFFAVKNPATGETIGYDYATLAEYRKGGESWLKNLAGDLEYKEDRKEVVFLLNGTTAYRGVSFFYKNPAISFRCCAYPE